MEALEIQVLSGVHAGARYRISKSAFRMASDDQADLVLLDASVAEADLSFYLADNGDGLAVMSRSGYDILDTHGLAVRPQTFWAVGHYLVLADVCLGLALAGAPVMPLPGQRPAHEGGADEGGPAEEFAALIKRPQVDKRARAVGDDIAPAPAADPDQVAARRSRRTASMVLISIVVLVLLAGLGVALLAMQADQELQESMAAKAAQAAAVVAVSPAATSSTLAVSPEELSAQRMKTAQEALVTMLARAGLDEEVELAWKDDAVLLTASINTGVVPQLESVLLDFERDYGELCKLDAKVTPLSITLPFRIREVVTGPQGWIVTDQGDRVLLGGVVSGYKLTTLGPERVVFSGPRRVEIDL